MGEVRARGKRGYKHVTQHILVVLERFSILTAVVQTKTYTGDKIV